MVYREAGFFNIQYRIKFHSTRDFVRDFARAPHKDTRKIIKVGHTSFAVILPKAWLRYFNLDHDDRVEVISNSEIVIRPLETS